MDTIRTLSRRKLIGSAMAAGLIVAAPSAAFAKMCAETPRQPEGPFYMGSAERLRNDLTWAGHPSRPAQGDVIHIAGQVTDRDCKPLPGVRVEIWQACVTGRYSHPGDRNSAWMDPNFGYFGNFFTGADGRYAFKTIKPGAYRISRSLMRPAHIHFKINGGRRGRLTTQMYFEGDAHIKTDYSLRSMPTARRKRLILAPGRNPDNSGQDLYRFDISLA